MRTFNKKDFFSAGNFMVSIGIHKTSEVALFSKTTGHFVNMNKQNLKRSKTLRKVKRELKSWLNADNTFTFSHMTPDTTNKLVQILKAK